MAAQKGVVTAGTWYCDHNKLVDEWPSEDGLATIIAEEWHGAKVVDDGKQTGVDHLGIGGDIAMGNVGGRKVGGGSPGW